ncbi:uncharacterized protein EAF01_012061 [Botrytis porri]|uniref:Uncharacterized protein n=1 Tax=Botrytis porri TaxID=87229 RepID=A0A4Z1KKD1_9HELO|nr:uncharacterized protein EAF01_012061 [Botrytis porri]KAF7880166.1 hypothetical protein EAF01_012061 [Botrytis porri]TGO81909.1 hypothetical protein BPOR_0975g00040 [Botrytis porri]
MPKYTVQRNEGVVTKGHPNVITQAPIESTYQSEIFPLPQLYPRMPTTPTPSHQNTAHKLASLLQEVASVMDTITGEKMMCGEELDGLEGDVLGGLTEMVLIMEEEVEGMIELADIVEEYVEELEMAELDGWVADLPPLKINGGNKVRKECWESENNAVNVWGGNHGSLSLGDGNESIRIGLDDAFKGRMSLGGLLDEVEEDVLGWRVRGMSVNSDSYGSDELSGVVLGSGVSMPIKIYRKDVIKPTVISLPSRKIDSETKFRDSALGLMSPAGVTRKPIKKEPRIVVKSSPIGLRTGLGYTRRKKTVKKPQWV